MITKHLIQSRQSKGTALQDSHKTTEPQDATHSTRLSEDEQARPDVSMRPVWIILFAAILILICAQSKAAEQQVAEQQVAEQQVAFVDASDGYVTPASSSVSQATLTIELNGEFHVIKPAWKPVLKPSPASVSQASVSPASVSQASVSPASVSQASVSQANSSGVQQASWISAVVPRPAYAHLSAHLANFDADADPDGWRAEVVLFDRDDHPIAVRGQASFELMPRIPTGDFHYYVDAATKPITWSEKLMFDTDAVARFKLPLRSPLRTSWGWSSANYRRTGPSTGLLPATFGRRSSIHRAGSNRSIHPRFLGTGVARDIRSSLGKPQLGELRVRVSVPGEGVFDAVSVVPIRPAVLVDTHWPYL